MGGFICWPTRYLIPNNTKKGAKISVVDSIASAISAYELPKACRPLIRAKQAFQ
jgi:alpha-L-fucosidase